MTERGHGWVVCQRHSEFILPALFLNSESWVAVRRSGIWPEGSWLILLCDVSLTRLLMLLSSCSTASHWNAFLVVENIGNCHHLRYYSLSNSSSLPKTSCCYIVYRL